MHDRCPPPRRATLRALNGARAPTAVQLLSKLNHPFIVTCHESFLAAGKLYVP